MRILAPLLATLVLAACAQLPGMQGERLVDYSCEHGTTMRVRYFADQEKAVVLRDGQALELRQQPAASGVLYTNGRTTLRGKGSEVTLEVGRMAPLRCVAR